MIELKPRICNICSGKVIYTSNAEIYGAEYGSGRCYLCLKCGAHVGTHKSRPKEALGLLADERMRKGKILCHEIFDSKWKGRKKAGKKRSDLYI
jgi:DNA-directed RNA polymerase subunit RPC12/RpoP